MSKLVFETKVCGRCGGTGQYSYCQQWGTTCFNCGGSGKGLTTRGKAAREVAEQVLTDAGLTRDGKRFKGSADRLAVGDVVGLYVSQTSIGWFTVERIETHLDRPCGWSGADRVPHAWELNLTVRAHDGTVTTRELSTGSRVFRKISAAVADAYNAVLAAHVGNGVVENA